jgi:quinol monooxygenase YgiN
MKDVCEAWEDEDEMKTHVTSLAQTALKNELTTQKSAHQHLNENQRIVSTWKSFLKG